MTNQQRAKAKKEMRKLIEFVNTCDEYGLTIASHSYKLILDRIHVLQGGAK